MDAINLGKKWGDSVCCSPAPALSEKERISFPTVYLDQVKGLDLPDSGVITFRYEVCNENRSPKNGSHGYSLDLLQILEVKEDEKSKKIIQAKDVLDSLAAEESGEDAGDDENESDRSKYTSE